MISAGGEKVNNSRIMIVIIITTMNSNIDTLKVDEVGEPNLKNLRDPCTFPAPKSHSSAVALQLSATKIKLPLQGRH